MSTKKPRGWKKNAFGMIDPKAVAKMDRLSAFIAYHWPFSHLTDLHELFGPEKLAVFMETFAGVTIRVPTKESFESALRDHDIYERLRDKGATATELAAAYRIDVRSVYEIYRRVESFYQLLEQESSS